MPHLTLQADSEEKDQLHSHGEHHTDLESRQCLLSLLVRTVNGKVDLTYRDMRESAVEPILGVVVVEVLGNRAAHNDSAMYATDVRLHGN